MGFVVLLLAAAGGACVGSFVHTCAHRVPRGLSVLAPRSHCARCGRALGAADLVPLLSYLFLRGRCRHCGAPIGRNHFLIELAAGALAVVSLLAEGFGPGFLRSFALGCVFLAIAVVDHRRRIIPNPFVAAGLIVVLIAAPWTRIPSLWASGAGLLMAGGSFALLREGYRLLRGREGMGWGDVKLAALMGAALGPAGWLLATLLGSLAGTAIGVTLMLRGRATIRSALPFGAYLSWASIGVLLGAPLAGW